MRNESLTTPKIQIPLLIPYDPKIRHAECDKLKYKKMKSGLLTIFLCLAFNSSRLPEMPDKEMMVDAVNLLRSKGCYCGRRYMPPVPPVQWSDHLYVSAFNQAEEMHRHNYFSHFSREGLNIGERLEKVGYNWMVAGENLGEGQQTFEEVMQDWQDSYSHCKMLMHPRVTEMAVAKVNRYWVQHFGKPMPEKK